MSKKTRILGIPGSLRTNSSSHAILRAAAGMMPHDIEFTIYDGVGSLPHFDDTENEQVSGFRNLLRTADAVFICTPEYAFGVPGSLKNALDWTVSSGDFDQKPVALITASSVGEKGHAAMLQILTAISARIPEGATLLISFIRAKLNEKGEIKDAATENAVRSVVLSLLSSL